MNLIRSIPFPLILEVPLEPAHELEEYIGMNKGPELDYNLDDA